MTVVDKDTPVDTKEILASTKEADGNENKTNTSVTAGHVLLDTYVYNSNKPTATKDDPLQQTAHFNAMLIEKNTPDDEENTKKKDKSTINKGFAAKDISVPDATNTNDAAPKISDNVVDFAVGRGADDTTLNGEGSGDGVSRIVEKKICKTAKKTDEGGSVLGAASTVDKDSRATVPVVDDDSATTIPGMIASNMGTIIKAMKRLVSLTMMMFIASYLILAFVPLWAGARTPPLMLVGIRIMSGQAVFSSCLLLIFTSLAFVAWKATIVVKLFWPEVEKRALATTAEGGNKKPKPAPAMLKTTTTTTAATIRASKDDEPGHFANAATATTPATSEI